MNDESYETIFVQFVLYLCETRVCVCVSRLRKEHRFMQEESAEEKYLDLKERK